MESYTILASEGQEAMLRLRNYALGLLVVPVLFIFLWLLDMLSGIGLLILAGIFCFIVSFLLFLYFSNYKVVFSHVRFLNDCIQVLDSRNHIWKVYYYSKITKIKTMELNGILHGYNGISTQGKYIVFFLDGCDTFPGNNIKAILKSDDCFAVLYRKELWDLLTDRMSQYF